MSDTIDIRGPHEVIADNDGKTPWGRIEGMMAPDKSGWTFEFTCNNPELKIIGYHKGGYFSALCDFIDFIKRAIINDFEYQMKQVGSEGVTR